MIVFSPMIWMTSPSSCSSPTNWTSYIRGRSPVAVTTGPATRKISPVPFASAPLSRCLIAIARPPRIASLVQVDPDCPLDLLAQVLFLSLAHRDHDGPRRRLEASSHRVAERLHVVHAEDQDPDVRIVQDLRDLRLHGVPIDTDRLSDPRELEPLHELIPSDSGEFHLRSPVARG